LTTTPNPCTSNGSGSFSCSITVPAGAATGDHTVFASDNASPADSASATFTVKRMTSTSVACLPSPVNGGSTTTCTATVADTDSGTPSTPTGTVSFASTRADAIHSLGTSGTLSSGSYSVTFTPS